MLAGAFLIALLGLYDDFFGAGAKTKFTVQVLVAAAMFFCGIRIDRLVVPWTDAWSLGVLALPLTVIWIVGVINAVNLIDGLDGLAGGVAVIALVSIFTFSLIRGDGLMMFASASLAGAVLGFLFFNFNPARIFMGDTGSMFLGFILAVTSLMSSQKSQTTVALVAPVMVLALPIGDTTLAIVRRWLHRRPIFDADRGHVHHRLLAAGYSQRQAVLLLYGLCMFFGAMAQLIWVANDRERIAIVACVAGLAFIFARRLGCLRPAIDEPTLVDAATVLFIPQQDLLRARTEDEIWRLVRRFAAAAGASAVSATLARDAGSVAYHSELSASDGGCHGDTPTGLFQGDAVRTLRLVLSDPSMSRSLCRIWVVALGRSVEEAAQRLRHLDRSVAQSRESTSVFSRSSSSLPE